MAELKGEGDCPTCGKHFKNLERHKCKVTDKPIKKAEKPVKVVNKSDDEQKVNDESRMLAPNDTYLSAGVHIGTKFRSKSMSDYIFKVRPDGLAILNVEKIDERLRDINNYLTNFKPSELLIVCKRDNATKPLKLLSMATGIKTITGRYLPGTMTNPNYDDFIEPKVVIITDVWYDKQALTDAVKSGAVVIALCNTNTAISNVDVIMPCNNKGHKSLSLVYWIIARDYCKANGLPFNYTLEQFS
ncbi:MAG: 30S ribosomal protein S2 [Candidatus Nanoarchaeia archaeon]|jgi:small subunit ribosomal protein S2